MELHVFWYSNFPAFTVTDICEIHPGKVCWIRAMSGEKMNESLRWFDFLLDIGQEVVKAFEVIWVIRMFSTLWRFPFLSQYRALFSSLAALPHVRGGLISHQVVSPGIWS